MVMLDTVMTMNVIVAKEKLDTDENKTLNHVMIRLSQWSPW